MKIKRGIAVKKDNIFNKFPIKINEKNKKGFFKYNNVDKMSDNRYPFFTVRNKRETVSCFIDAINSNKYDTALSFISKRVTNIDFNELNDIFKNKKVCKCVVVYKPKGSNNKIVSVALGDIRNNIHEIIHVKMIKEPNKQSEWKICEIITE